MRVIDHESRRPNIWSELKRNETKGAKDLNLFVVYDHVHSAGMYYLHDGGIELWTW